MLNSRRIAEKWAAAHPTESAELHIVTDGRSGYGQNIHVWYADGGQVAKEELGTVFHTSNGRCQICGRLFLDAVLKIGYAPDPDAGALVADEQQLDWLRGKVIRAAVASVRACPECVAAQELDTDYSALRSGWLDDRFHVLRSHPALCRFPHRLPPIRIDERPAARQQPAAPRRAAATA